MNKIRFINKYIYIYMLMLGFAWQMPLAAVTEYARNPQSVASALGFYRTVYQGSDSNNNWFIMYSFNFQTPTQLSTVGRNAFKPFITCYANSNPAGTGYLALWYEIDPTTNNNVLMAATASVSGNSDIVGWQNITQISNSAFNVTGDYSGSVSYNNNNGTNNNFLFVVTWSAYDSSGGLGAYGSFAGVVAGNVASWSTQTFIGGS